MSQPIETLSAAQQIVAQTGISCPGKADVAGTMPVASVTGTATIVIGQMALCTGTTSDYTVTLPPAASNTGKSIGVRMSLALTKLVTVKGNASELIDGQNARVMWAGEFAVMTSDGTGWYKSAGRSIPMYCMGSLQSIVSIPGPPGTSLLVTPITDPAGLFLSSIVTIRRSGTYISASQVRWSGITGLFRYTGGIWRLRSSVTIQFLTVAEIAGTTAVGFESCETTTPIDCLIGDQYTLTAAHTNGVAQSVAGNNVGNIETFMSFIEINVW